jgi:hypothetical protein
VLDDGSQQTGSNDAPPIRTQRAEIWNGLLRRLSRHRERPGAVITGGKSQAILQLAQHLALQRQDNQAAIAELTAAARGNRRTLKRALRASRFGGYYRELAQANLVYRLLDAASSGKPIAAVSLDVRHTIDAVAAMRDRPEKDRWALLVEHEPRLSDLEAQVNQGAFGALDQTETPSSDNEGPEIIAPDGSRATMHLVGSSSDAQPSADETWQTMNQARGIMALRRRVSELLGPDSPQQDVLLKSVTAQDEAVSHLIRESG